jgi:hypothetical protein
MRQESRRTASNVESSIPSWHTYRLKFVEDDRGVQKDVEFEAEDAAMALVIAHKEASNRSAELWCDGHKLCTIRRTEHDVWEISSQTLERLSF